jgi:hypothetical protein
MTQTNDLRVGRCAWEVADHYYERRLPGSRRIVGNKKQKFAGLEHTIDSAVVPRLIAALKGPVPAAPANESKESQSAKVSAFADLALHYDVREVCSAIEDLRATGFSLEEIYLGLLAPTATRLCSLWKTDDCGFADSALALWRLQQVLREFSIAFRSEFMHREHGLRVLLAPAPDERQDIAYAMFGMVFVSEFFVRDGWDAWIEPDSSSNDFATTIRDQWFDVAEFLVCGDTKSETLTSCARTIRRDSPNQSVGIMACSQPFLNNPKPVCLADDDLTAGDTKQNPLEARRFVGSCSD